MFENWDVNPELLPVLSFFDVGWPDIQESKLWDFGDDLGNLGQAVRTNFGEGVGKALEELRLKNRSAALDSVWSYWLQHIEPKFLEPVGDALFDAQNCFHTAYDIVHWVKAGLLMQLDITVGSDLYSLGLKVLLEKMVKQVGKKEIEKAFRYFLDEGLSRVRNEVTGAIRTRVEHEIEVALNAVKALADEAISSLPGLHLPTVDPGAAGSRLVVDLETLNQAKNLIVHGIEDVVGAARQLGKAAEEGFREYSSSHGDSDSSIRHEIESFLATDVMPSVVTTAEEVCRNLIVHVTGILDFFGSEMQAVDANLRQTATGLSKGQSASPPVGAGGRGSDGGW